MSAGWINTEFTSLPGTDDDLFRELWTERRLIFDEHRDLGDAVDECSARLVAAALRRRQRLLVVLPDFQPYRPAFLFATSLIRSWWDSRELGATGSLRGDLVLYFGSAIGVRDQLRRTSVLNLRMSLGEVFNQQDVSRGSAGIRYSDVAAQVGVSGLPRVVTVYAPSDPVGVVNAYNPSWIAIDLWDVPSLVWLRPLLDEAARREIALIAWGQNPLSECVSDFDHCGQTFIWPPSIQPVGYHPRKLEGAPDALLNSQGRTSLSPVVLDGRSVTAFSALLNEATQLLVRVMNNVEGRFRTDAVRVHWRYLRSLESLAVPVDFYDAEAPRFWGLRSFVQLRSACEQFRKACEQSAQQLHVELERVGTLLHQAERNLIEEGCPLWSAIGNMCIDDVAEDEVRILTFAGDSRKRLFLFALLARHNITEEELNEVRTYVASLNDVRRWMHYRHLAPESKDAEHVMPPEDLNWHPVLIGLPSAVTTPRLLPLFLQPKVEFVLYPHQCPSFIRRHATWAERLSASHDRVVGSLAQLGGVRPLRAAYAGSPRLAVVEGVRVSAETAIKTNASLAGPLWKPSDIVSEVAHLLMVDDEFAEEDLVLTDQAEGGARPQTELSEELLCPEAMKVQFEQGWSAHFAPDDAINVVLRSSGNVLDQRSVRSLRVGDRVLLIHGQQRQSLYDLIISRVHKHPSIELHLAMIRRWQEDLRVAFDKWEGRGSVSPTDQREFGARDLTGLLRRMQSRGSSLVSTLTLSFWLRGAVMCPLDPEDLRRVADVLEMGFVKHYHVHIAHAANRLRGLHRGLSRKLNRWLEEQASEGVQRYEEDVIDAELGLTFGDLSNSFIVLRVIAIENVRGPFLRNGLGRAEKD